MLVVRQLELTKIIMIVIAIHFFKQKVRLCLFLILRLFWEKRKTF